MSLSQAHGANADEERAPDAGRFRLLRQIASGGMAEIFLAEIRTDISFEKNVAIKRLRREKAKDPRVAAMFADEAYIGGRLSHPNVAQVFDAGVMGDTPFIAMELVLGEELNELCRRSLELGRFLPLRHGLELIRQAAVALSHVHHVSGEDGVSLEVVHCDISPTNLLVTRDGFLKLIDLGISRFRGQGYIEQDVVPGKLSYMSPEQARRAPLDRRSDIYSLGVVLYEIALETRLFRGAPADIYERVASGDVPPPTFVKFDFNPDLEAIIMRALDRDPDERFQEAYALADAISEFARNNGLESSPTEVARYLDTLDVMSGGERRPELYDDANKGKYTDFEAAHEEIKEALSEDVDEPVWAQQDDNLGAVADALGIDVSLVSDEAKYLDAGNEAVDFAEESVDKNPLILRQSPSQPQPQPQPQPESSVVKSELQVLPALAAFVLGALLAGVMGWIL